MLLSDWYANWKEKRIQAAVEAATAKGYEDGYADGKLGTLTLKGIHLTRERHTKVISRGKKSQEKK